MITFEIHKRKKEQTAFKVSALKIQSLFFGALFLGIRERRRSWQRSCDVVGEVGQGSRSS